MQLLRSGVVAGIIACGGLCVAATPANRAPAFRVMVTNERTGTLSVIDGGANTVVATIPTGRGPFGLAADPVSRRVFVVNGYDDTVWAIDAATLAVAET